MSFYPVYSKEKENVIIKEKSAPLPEKTMGLNLFTIV